MENLQEIIWGKISSGVKGFIKLLIENLLEEELTAKVGAPRYERYAGRTAYRNGHYLRNLMTRYGVVDGIHVPRMGRGGMEFTVLSSLDEELSRFKDTPIEDTVEFLFLNGISQKVREIGIEKKVMLCAFGIFRKCEGEEERAVRYLKNDLFGCLHYFDFDKELWKSIRTTNILERAFREVRRRTMPINNFFTNEASANRIMYGISDMLNKNWKDKTLKVISTN